MLRSLRRLLATAGLGLLGLIGLAILIGGVVHILHGHDDPSLAGKGRLHDPFVQNVKCYRLPSRTCEHDPSVKLDLPNGETQDVSQKPLYDLVTRRGPVAVQVEWVKDIESPTRVRYRGRWYFVNHFAGGSDYAYTIVAMVLLGIPLTLFGGGLFLGRVLPDDETEPDASPA